MPQSRLLSSTAYRSFQLKSVPFWCHDPLLWKDDNVEVEVSEGQLAQPLVKMFMRVSGDNEVILHRSIGVGVY